MADYLFDRCRVGVVPFNVGRALLSLQINLHTVELPVGDDHPKSRGSARRRLHYCHQAGT